MTLRTVFTSLVFAGGVLVASAQPRVVATSPVLGDLVKNIGGEAVSLTVLVPAGGDPHVFEPKPRDLKTVKNADLLFEVGLGYETWLDKVYSSSGSKAKRVVTSEGIQPVKMEEAEEPHGEHEKEHHHADEHKHEHGEMDPHVWTDPMIAIEMCKNITSTLKIANPDQAAMYDKNADAYIARLVELDRWIKSEVKSLPRAQRKLVTSHDWLGYFANRYDFEVVGNILGAVSTEAAEPSAKQMALVAEAIRASGVKAVFAEAGHQNKALAQVAKSAGVKVAPDLFHEVNAPGTPADSYENMMRHNVRVIVEALR